jgi:hypothetical protein
MDPAAQSGDGTSQSMSHRRAGLWKAGRRGIFGDTRGNAIMSPGCCTVWIIGPYTKGVKKCGFGFVEKAG